MSICTAENSNFVCVTDHCCKDCNIETCCIRCCDYDDEVDCEFRKEVL